MINLQLKARVEEKLKEIAEFILAYDYMNISPVNYLEGMAGMLPFLYDYGAYTQDPRFHEHAEKFIYHIVDSIEGGDVGHTFSEGIAGFAWVLEWLADKGHIERLSLLHPFDSRLYELMKGDLESGNWDALHGAVGVSFYLFKRIENPEVKKSLETMVDQFEATSEETESGIKWSRFDVNKGEKVYNFGLAHGMSSIMIFFAKCIEHDVRKEKSKDLLKSLIQYLKTNMNQNSQKEYIFKYTENGFDPGPRLAWCHGDLGASVAFQYVHYVLGGLEEETALLVNSLLSRRDVQKSNVRDVGFCHGGVGTVHIYNYLKQRGNDLVKIEDMEYWIEYSLSLAVYEDGFAGYKTYMAVDPNSGEKPWVPEIGLLTGVTGVASVFLSLLNGDLSWSEGLLLY